MLQCIGKSNTFPLISPRENEHHVISLGNFTKALLSTIATLLFSYCSEYQDPSERANSRLD